MSYEDFQSTEYSATVTAVHIKPLKEFIEEEDRLVKWEKFDEEGDRPTREVDHVQVTIDLGSYEKGFILGRDPGSRQGYTRSNVKKFIDKNGLPAIASQWIGKSVQMRDDAQGFPEIVL